MKTVSVSGRVPMLLSMSKYCVISSKSTTSLELAPLICSLLVKSLMEFLRPSTMALRWRATPTPARYFDSASASADLTLRTCAASIGVRGVDAVGRKSVRRRGTHLVALGLLGRGLLQSFGRVDLVHGIAHAVVRRHVRDQRVEDEVPVRVHRRVQPSFNRQRDGLLGLERVVERLRR